MVYGGIVPSGGVALVRAQAGAGQDQAQKVTRTPPQNAASIAGLLLTTECVVVEKKEEKSASAGGPPGGGMGGMY